jgi:hypothetical protein
MDDCFEEVSPGVRVVVLVGAHVTHPKANVLLLAGYTHRIAVLYLLPTAEAVLLIDLL